MRQARAAKVGVKPAGTSTVPVERARAATVGLGAACISSSAIMVRLADTGAGTTAVVRCALALPGLALLAHLERRRMGGRSSVARMKAIVAGGFLGVDLVLWTHAIYDVGAGIATVLGNLQVLFVAMIAWAIHGERPQARWLASLPIVMAGVVLVAGVIGHHPSGSDPAGGILFGLGTSITYAAFIVILRRSTALPANGTAGPDSAAALPANGTALPANATALPRKGNSAAGTGHTAGPLADATLGAAVAALLVSLPFHEVSLVPTWPAFGWLALLAFVSQTAGWLLITSALPSLPAAVSSLLLLLQPAAALVLADLVLGQRPSALQVVGAALVCGGVLFAVSSPASPSESERLAHGGLELGVTK